MKKILIALLGLILVALVAWIVIWNLNKQKNKPEVDTDYVLLENDYISYKYISSYQEYSNYVEELKLTKSDYYTSYSSNDFDGKNYLFVVVPYDSCSETIVNNKYKESNNANNVYLDMKYSCGVCAPSRKILSYEVKNKDLDVKIYTKELSRETCDPDVSYKPIIYIYPDKDMDLTVTLGKEENLLYTYPKYNNSWNVHVTTDGNIYDYDTKRNYYGLYWEGKDDYKLDMSKGFVVKGEDTVKLLEDKLSILGLNDYEINEFIVYWIDKLESNNYNFISFRSLEDIEKSMPLTISKKPETLIRVMMDYKPLDEYIDVQEQQLTKVERKGYTVVEWGGTKH